MKINFISKFLLAVVLALNGFAPAAFSQNEVNGDAEQKRAAEWVAALKLDDATKAARVTEVVTTHLKAVRDWHNSHSATNVPAGINPVTGKKLNEIDRAVIADSTIPKSVHEHLMAGLRQDLSEAQVAAVLDKYTVGKVAFTMSGYRGIVTNMTPNEEEFIMEQLTQAREEAVDYKNMKEISVIFKIHKTQIETWLNEHGRDWKTLYKNFVNGLKAQKTATGVEANSVPAAE